MNSIQQTRNCAAELNGMRCKRYSNATVVRVGLTAVDLYSKADSLSGVLESIPAGTTLTVLAEKGNYYQVKYNQTGWVRKIDVNVETTTEKSSGFSWDTLLNTVASLGNNAAEIFGYHAPEESTETEKRNTGLWVALGVVAVVAAVLAVVIIKKRKH